MLTHEDFRNAYKGHGRAVRERDENPYPGEPYMSMDDAARLSANLVAAYFASQADFYAQQASYLRTDINYGR